jgi:hypothetical protein
MNKKDLEEWLKKTLIQHKIQIKFLMSFQFPHKTYKKVKTQTFIYILLLNHL